MNLPRKLSLSDQVVELLRQGIRQGQWIDWLPSERQLSEELKVNRRTLRAAARQLETEGWLKSIPRLGKRIGRPARKRSRSKRSAVISILAFDLTSPQAFSFESIWTHLQHRCLQSGMALELHQGKQFFRKNPVPALERLVSSHQSDCWIVRSRDPRVQHWFAEKQIPAVVWGQCSENLPAVLVDIGATARHAAGTLLGAGHRQLALFVERSSTYVSQSVFEQTVEDSGHSDARVSVYEYDPDARSLRRALEQCLHARPAFTGLFVTRVYSYLAITSLLHQAGRNIPRDLSVISRDDSPIFHYLSPEPARFVFSASRFANQLHTMASRIIHGEVLTRREIKLLPEFIRGESIAVPPRD